jgi:hypothetical protein
MTDAEIFGKLSRIFETHGFLEDDDDELNELLNDFYPEDGQFHYQRSDSQSPSRKFKT